MQDKHFFVGTTFRSYCKELNCVETTKEHTEHFFLVKSNIHRIRRKMYSYETKMDSELREKHFFAVTTFRNYCKELNCMEMTKECPESKDKHFYARS